MSYKVIKTIKCKGRKELKEMVLLCVLCVFTHRRDSRSGLRVLCS
jgi:hypothetical protein